eukprot:CAMPEP_0171970406 /NCGR_PEP_ID=MMETSP0993-20121228/212814_1 /TAXON_ID=483369 /ORGANISM="non described non described, Strain CCMP2098" /LENGTH=108 /DNA_ID=CAMNT_0012620509 /DNA_START=140 /DNA_END=466 /DNA_ORIENTATION=+
MTISPNASLPATGEIDGEIEVASPLPTQSAKGLCTGVGGNPVDDDNDDNDDTDGDDDDDDGGNSTKKVLLVEWVNSTESLRATSEVPLSSHSNSAPVTKSPLSSPGRS